ncbi:MAG: 4-(cytidine 5'-diphospho)-2-C-methyl-D-erythritol kinase, partial [Planctomycetes bacterium]|nr:4-(cytidine 5'-diphospho)-2-C-methyl-D-erythritol kinase [Planctomycetota bacterium]
MSEPVTWFLPARAKINLQLRVLGRRADGYHLLETLFHALELHDDLWLRRREQPGVALTVDADEPSLLVAPGDDNLVVRALRAFAARYPSPSGFDVRLYKRIPAGGGLGGGSSDAAAALRLAAAAHGLGDDVAAL